MNNEQAPKISEDLVTKITKAAMDAALAEVNHLLGPLVEKVKALEEGKQSRHNVLPQREGLIAIEERENQESEDVPWYEKLGIE